MRQQLHNSYKAPKGQTLNVLKPNQLDARGRKTSDRKRRIRNRQESSGITVTPLRGFFIALLFLGVPTVSLGGLCFALLQNNLRLSQTNDELSEIANEVKAEIDTLGEEIDTLKERAGVPETSGGQKSSDLGNLNNGRKASAASLNLTVRGGGSFAKSFPPKGGLENTVNALDLLEDAKQQVPVLNQALDSAIKPALEKTLAEEAAHPSGPPVVGRIEVSSEFGLRSNPFSGSGYEMHEGMDFVGEHGDIIAATGNGVVTLAGPNGGYGNTVTIEHGYGYETLYAHMSQVRVNVGDKVKRGQIIGHIGSTGRSSGPHLHYTVSKNEKAIDPRMVLKLPENTQATGPR